MPGWPCPHTLGLLDYSTTLTEQRRRSPDPAVLRGIVRTALRKAGWANTASARRAHVSLADVLTLHGIP
jgi:hypothetical protein